MSNTISTNVNLAAFQGATILQSGKNKDVECILIPIAMNHFIRTAEGAVYVDLTGYELKNKVEGKKNTHIVKQSLPKDVYSAMSEEEKQAMPIVGNHVVWAGQSSPAATAPVASDPDDLPF